jgi:hypothetical protein
VPYTPYLITFAVDSVGDVFGTLFAVAAGLLVIEGGSCRAGSAGFRSFWILFFLQGFTLGGVIAKFALALHGIGFVLLLIFVLVSSVILLKRGTRLVVASG